MTKIELPEMPQPAAYTTQVKEGRVLFMPRIALNVDGMTGIFTADQLRARDRQIVELCIQAAENAEAGDGSHDYNAGAETMQERIVAAIRNLLGDQHG